jgi:hypothetical protein
VQLGFVEQLALPDIFDRQLFRATAVLAGLHDPDLFPHLVIVSPQIGVLDA